MICKKYLECFTRQGALALKLERFDRHNEMLRSLVAKHSDLQDIDFRQIKLVSKEVTDNLDLTIGLPFDGVFDPEEYSVKLETALLGCLRNKKNCQIQ